MGLFGWLKKGVRGVASLRPLLRLLGVKDKTVAGKAAEVAEEIDRITTKKP